MSEQANFIRKYFMMGSQDVPEGKDAADILEKAVQAGVTAFEYRERGDNQVFGMDKLDLATKLRKICKQHDIPFIVDDTQMVRLMDADGIHVGHDSDINLEKLRKQFPDKLIGLTVTSEEQKDGGQFAMVDYIMVGPVYKDLPHSNGEKPIEMDFLKKLSSTYPTIHVVAFGGIDESNADDIIKKGANGVAVISAITEAGESMKDVIGKL